jgi:hypothetical protein
MRGRMIYLWRFLNPRRNPCTLYGLGIFTCLPPSSEQGEVAANRPAEGVLMGNAAP